jgi:hypothetical protein
MAQRAGGECCFSKTKALKLSSFRGQVQTFVFGEIMKPFTEYAVKRFVFYKKAREMRSEEHDFLWHATSKTEIFIPCGIVPCHLMGLLNQAFEYASQVDKCPDPDSMCGKTDSSVQFSVVLWREDLSVSFNFGGM